MLAAELNAGIPFASSTSFRMTEGRSVRLLSSCRFPALLNAGQILLATASFPPSSQWLNSIAALCASSHEVPRAIWADRFKWWMATIKAVGGLKDDVSPAPVKKLSLKVLFGDNARLGCCYQNCTAGTAAAFDLHPLPLRDASGTHTLAGSGSAL